MLPCRVWPGRTADLGPRDGTAHGVQEFLTRLAPARVGTAVAQDIRALAEVCRRIRGRFAVRDGYSYCRYFAWTAGVRYFNANPPPGVTNPNERAVAIDKGLSMAH